MNVGPGGENLVFLLSQPRAGSTLFQRILGGHPEIHTVSEPWLMLHPFYSLRPGSQRVEYDVNNAREATLQFVQALPGGDEAYLEGVRRMSTYLYGLALENSGKRYFLDKTPPYYLIIPELYRLFPDARYIVLLRNPLAVLNSLLTKWMKGNWMWLHHHSNALMSAPDLLLEGIDLLGPNGLVVHYEQLVEHPAEELRRACDRLHVEFRPEIIDYGRTEAPRWNFGDEVEIYQHKRPMQENATKWTRGLAHPQVWRFTNDYLHLLGRDTIERMGYPYDQLQEALDARRPNSKLLWRTLPLTWALRQPIDQGVKQGLREVMNTGARKALFAVSGRGFRSDRQT